MMTVEKNQTPANPVDARGIIITALVISAIGASFYNLLPLILGTAQDFRQLSDTRMGLIGSAFFLGYNMTTASAFFWIRRINWKLVCGAGLLVAAASMLLVTTTQGYIPLLVSITLAGAAFGIVYGVGTTIIGDTSRAARWYGIKIALEAGLGVVLLILLPSLVIPRWGMNGMFIALAAVVASCLLLLHFIPATGSKNTGLARTPQASAAARNSLPIWLGLIALCLFFTGETAAWAFVERIGNSAGMDAAAVSLVLSLSLACAVAGSILAAAIEGRYRFVAPFVVNVLVFYIGLAGLAAEDSLLLYGAGACLMMFSVGFGLPLLLSSIEALDSDGRFIILTVPAIGIGAMVAPGMAGYLSDHVGASGAFAFSFATVTAALVFQILSGRHGSLQGTS